MKKTLAGAPDVKKIEIFFFKKKVFLSPQLYIYITFCKKKFFTFLPRGFP